MTGYLTVLPLPDGHGADAVAAHLRTMPCWFARTLTWDNAKEMARCAHHRHHPRTAASHRRRTQRPTPQTPQAGRRPAWGGEL
jgi:hypothetical protein